MTLTELLRHADSSSLRLRASQSAVEAAQAGAQAASANMLLPDLKVQAAVGYLGDGYGWGRDSNYSFTVAMPHFSTQFGLEAKQVVFAGGALAAAREEARLGASLAQLDYRQKRQDLHLLLTGHYLDLFRLSKQVEVYDSNIVLAERLIADIDAKCRQGAALRTDLTRHQIRLAELQTGRSTAVCEMNIVRSTIATLAGLPPTTAIVPDSSCLQPLLTPSSEGAEPLSVQQAETRLQLSEANYRHARATRLPYVALVANDHLNGPVTIDITPYDINYNYWFVGLALGYDLSSLWKGNSRLRAASLGRQGRLLEQQDIQEQSQLAIRAATLRLQEAQSRLAVKKETMRLADENYVLMVHRYKADLALLADILDAANQKIATQLDYITARIDIVYRQALLQYLHGEL